MGKLKGLIRLVVLLLLGGAALWTSRTTQSLYRHLEQPLPLVAPFSYGETQGRWSPRAEPLPHTVPVPVVVERGDTVAGLLAGLGLEPSEVSGALGELTSHADLRTLRAGERCLAYLDKGQRLERFRIPLKGTGWAEVTRQGDIWTGNWQPFHREVRLRRAVGSLEESLNQAIYDAGGRVALAAAMANVLQWDLDFHRDLRLGDRFRVLYEEIYLDGRYGRMGNILALQYEQGNRRLEAYRFGEEGGYYDAEGRPLRKLFLRSPLPFTRVTSRFSHRRFHPVLKVYRPHYGVDYGAPSGTPVRVTATGTVSFAAWAKGAGRMVKVRHPNGYQTAYLHLSRFAKGIRPGRRVTQGELIGYVGSNGLSTGPHLDYRVQKGGRWIDPLSIQPVPAEPIPGHRLAAFRDWRQELVDALEARTAGDQPLLLAQQREPGKGSATALGH